jgi:hypothetical protein
MKQDLIHVVVVLKDYDEAIDFYVSEFQSHDV